MYIDLDSAKKLRGYFGKNDATVFEHWAYNYFDNIVKGASNSICDCQIPKPIDAYHPEDKHICSDCKGQIQDEN